MEAPQTRSKSGGDVVLILDYGSPYTHLIASRIRSLSILPVCISGGDVGTSSTVLKAIIDLKPRVIIVSGAPHSLHTPNNAVLSLPDGLIDYVESNGVFMLGICHGLQLILQSIGGEVVVVKLGQKQEYGETEIVVVSKINSSHNNNNNTNNNNNCGLFGSKEIGDRQVVWMSRSGDHEAYVKLPDGFEVVARTLQGLVAAVENPARRFYGLHYHPEVTHSPEGMETLRSFLLNVCGITTEWKMKDFLDERIKGIKDMVGPEDHVICPLSTNMDCTVAATLVHKAIGNRLHCVFIDNGLLRYKERERVMKTFENDLRLPVTCVEATGQFLRKLKGVIDSEMKRKIIGQEFNCIFDDFAKGLELKVGRKPAYLVQGTLYPNVIESSPPYGNGISISHIIKSHHNVGMLPNNLKLKLIEPLKLLFKEEVHELGRLLDVPDTFLKRHPFPGSGLAIRVRDGDVTEENALDILRQADEIFIQSIKDAGIYDSMCQASVFRLPVKSTGVQGDQRTHSHVLGLRAVTIKDGITMNTFKFDSKFLKDVSGKICNSVRGVNRIVLCLTPPPTIGWE